MEEKMKVRVPITARERGYKRKYGENKKWTNHLYKFVHVQVYS